jgi:hypothetical protein
LGVSFALDFLNNKEGWSAAGYKFLNTNDGGETWNEELTPESTIVYDLQFVDQYTGFACGQDGVLLKYTSYKKYVPDKPTFEIGQNYPNPFSEKTTFYVYSATPDFDLPARAQIKLYDILGNELLTLADQDFYSGVYEFIFNPSRDYKNISSGIYFLTLTSGDIKQSTKILYLK